MESFPLCWQDLRNYSGASARASHVVARASPAALLAAPSYASDRRVMDNLGGWTASYTTRQDTYKNREDERLFAATAAVRRAWRSGERMTLEGIPASSGWLPALLPQALRAAVLAPFGDTPSLSVVGIAVGTNDNAAGIEDSGGAVSR